VPHLGHLRLDELRTSHVAEMLAEVPGVDATRRRVRASLRAALNDAMREGLISVNPAALVKLPSGKRPRALVWTAERVDRWQVAVNELAGLKADSPRRPDIEAAAQPPSAVMVWTPVQLGAFLDVAAADRLYALWHLVAHRGLRRGEAAGVEWVDVDLAAGTPTVRRQLVQVGWAVVERPPESDAGNRTVALDGGTVAALREHRKRQLADRMTWGAARTESGKVFVREDGQVLHPAAITDRFHALVAEAGLPPVRLHDLRHGAASIMLAVGVPMKVVQETLGHSSSTLTADTYTGVYPTVAAEAAEAAAALVPKSATGTEVHTRSTYTETARPGAPKSTRSSGAPRGNRTPNPLIKSQLLCRLS
jgi:integrase